MRRYFRVSRLGLLALTAVLWTHPAQAQGPTTGSINGVVRDNTGAVLPGVTVTARSPSEITAFTQVTNERGQYRFPAVTPGTYTLTFGLDGFNTLARPDIDVSLGFTATVDVQLEMGGRAEQVTVVAEPPLVDIQNTNFQQTYKAETLEAMPNSRDMWSIIAQAPGTRVNSFDMGGTIAGTQSTYSSYGFEGQNRVQLDGINNTEGQAGGRYFDYGAFDQVTLGTASNDAQMPVPGVLINAVLKSGGNTFRGSMLLEYANRRLQSTNVDDTLRRQGIGRGTRVNRYLDPNFSLGGPIQRDKAWFFGSLRFFEVERAAANWPANEPGTGPDDLVRTWNATYKLTYQLSRKDKLSHYLQLSRKHQPYRDISGDAYLDSVQSQWSPSWSGALDWQRIHNESTFFTARLGAWGYNWQMQPYGVGGVLQENVDFRRLETNNDNVSGGIQDARLKRDRWQLELVGNKFFDHLLGGNHELKVGYLGEWEQAFNPNDGFRDSIRLQFNSTTAAGNFVTPYRIQIYNHPLETTNALWHHGAFLQDQFRVNGRLTLNLGLRFDHYSAYYPEQQIPAGPWRDFFYAGQPLPNGYSVPSSYPDFNIPARRGILSYGKLAPRLGVAWVIDQRSRTVLKASWGRFWRNSSTDISDNVNPAQGSSYTFAWNDRNGDRLFQTDEFGAYVASAGGVQNSIDPNIRNPWVDEANVWLERQVFRNITGRVAFIRKTSNDEWELFNIARPPSLFSFRGEALDPGPDGLEGTTDDGAPFAFYDYPVGLALPRSVFQWQTPAENDTDNRSLELTVGKRFSHRWSMHTSYQHTWQKYLSDGRPDNPNEEILNDARTQIWTFKIFGTFEAPWGLIVSPNLRQQNGSNLSRRVRVRSPRGNQYDIRVEPLGAHREPTTTIWDLRFQKRVRLSGAQRLEVFANVFNLLNKNTATGVSNLTGRRVATVDGERIEFQNFYRPTGILSPRFVHFGVRFNFGGASPASPERRANREGGEARPK